MVTKRALDAYQPGKLSSFHSLRFQIQNEKLFFAWNLCLSCRNDFLDHFERDREKLTLRTEKKPSQVACRVRIGSGG